MVAAGVPPLSRFVAQLALMGEDDRMVAVRDLFSSANTRPFLLAALNSSLALRRRERPSCLPTPAAISPSHRCHLGALTSRHWCSWGWYSQDPKSGAWVAYPAEATTALDAARRGGHARCELQLAGKVFTVDFAAGPRARPVRMLLAPLCGAAAGQTTRSRLLSGKQYNSRWASRPLRRESFSPFEQALLGLAYPTFADDSPYPKASDRRSGDGDRGGDGGRRSEKAGEEAAAEEPTVAEGKKAASTPTSFPHLRHATSPPHHQHVSASYS